MRHEEALKAIVIYARELVDALHGDGISNKFDRASARRSLEKALSAFDAAPEPPHVIDSLKRAAKNNHEVKVLSDLLQRAGLR